MNNRFVPILAALLLSLILTACPYKSNVPVTEADEYLKEGLMGKWVSSSELNYDHPTYYIVDEKNETEYKVTQYRYNNSNKMYTDNTYYMHTSTLDNKMFVNVKDEMGSAYYIFLLEMSDTELTLTEVSENIDEQFESSKELEKFFRKYKDLSFFYGKGEEIYYKRTNK